MADIILDFSIKTAPARVFEGISTPQGLDTWWTKRSSGRPAEGEIYELWFGPNYDWRAEVTICTLPSRFELKILQADSDWEGTRVGFTLGGERETSVSFYHIGWPLANAHWRCSCYCWAMYLRILRRH